MSRKGNCYDNAMIESFFGTVKQECVERERYQTRQEARQAIFFYMETFDTRKRRHSALGYVSPVVYEEQKMWEKEENTFQVTSSSLNVQ